MKTSRRDFIKSGAAGTIGAMVGNFAFPGVTNAQTGGWVTGKKINPLIDNLRVVGCVDKRMVKAVPISWSIADQNTAINASIVHGNMDEMAMQLAKKPTAREAWNTIFQLPPGKTWSQVTVAIKVNCKEPRNIPRVAIVEKVCLALKDLGVTPDHVIIYDADDNFKGTFSTYCSTTDPLKVPAAVSDKNSLLGGIKPITISGASNVACTTALANGTVDILVNIAVNKGHDATYGKITLCMKNMFGSFCNSNDQSNASYLHSTNALIGVNKSPELLGGTVTRQQLCIVDSIFASTDGPDASPEQAPCAIVMGVFAPAVDYITAKKIREVLFVPKATHSAVLAQLITAFGYTTAQMTDYVAIGPVSIGKSNLPARPSRRPLIIAIESAHLHAGAVEFALAEGETALSATVTDLKGGIIAKFPITARDFHQWNGKNQAGASLAQGTYIVALKTNRRVVSERVMVGRL